MEYIYYIIKLFNSTYNYKKRRKIIKNSTKIIDYENNDEIIVQIDCKGQYVEDVDFNKYRNLKNVTYLNLRDNFIKNRNNQ